MKEKLIPRPQQPEGHDTQCPCLECEDWAYALLDWEDAEVKAGRDPWAEFRI